MSRTMNQVLLRESGWMNMAVVFSFVRSFVLHRLSSTTTVVLRRSSACTKRNRVVIRPEESFKRRKKQDREFSSFILFFRQSGRAEIKMCFVFFICNFFSRQIGRAGFFGREFPGPVFVCKDFGKSAFID